MATMTTGNNPAAVNEWFDRKLLYRAKQAIVFEMISQQRPLRLRSGKTIVFRKYPALALAKTPLVESKPPTGTTVAHTDVTASILPYGDFIEVGDLVRLVVQEPLLNEYTDLQGQQAGETLDSLIADEAVVGSNVAYGGGAANRAALTSPSEKLDGPTLDRSIRLLDNNNTRRFNPRIRAGTAESTFGIQEGYWAIIHPDTYFTARDIAGWKDVVEYASMQSVAMHEVGAYRNIRFLMSTLSPVIREGGGAVSGDVKGTTNADVYQTVIAGRDALGTIPLAGNNLRMITKALGSAGAADPLDQIGSVGWKSFKAHKLLDDDYIIRVEHTCTEVAP